MMRVIYVWTSGDGWYLKFWVKFNQAVLEQLWLKLIVILYMASKVKT